MEKILQRNWRRTRLSEMLVQYLIILGSVVAITTVQLHSTKPELRFCASSNPARSVSEIRNGENLWQWSRLEIRLNLFRLSTIPQKQFVIIIIIIIIIRKLYLEVKELRRIMKQWELKMKKLCSETFKTTIKLNELNRPDSTLVRNSSRKVIVFYSILKFTKLKNFMKYFMAWT